MTDAVRISRRCRCTGERPNAVRRQRDPFPARSGLLVPSAVSSRQRELEAALLLAVNRAIARESGRGGSLINWVGPRTDSLRLEIAREAVVTFLAESLPVVVDGEVIGIPGLRPRPGRDFVDFHVLGSNGDRQAAVRLVGVSRGQCRDAIELVREADVQLWLECRDQLHALEAELVRRRAAQPVDFMSAVLRRFALLRGATWVESVVDGDAMSVYWRGGPDGRAVAAILGESECRIPGALVRSRRLSRLLDGVYLSPDHRGSVCVEPEWAWVALEIVPSTQADDLAVAVPAAPEEPVRSVHPEGDVWEKPDMRAALAARELSQVYRLLRKHGISQRQIAARTGQSQSEVSEILKGRQVMAYDVLARVAAGLGIPKGYMGLAYDEETRVGVVSTVDGHASREAESLKRRKFLAHAAAMTMGANVFGTDTGSWPSTALSESRLIMLEQRQLEAATRALRALDFQYGNEMCQEALAELVIATRAAQHRRQSLKHENGPTT